jgi:hypothetical protein
VSDGRRISDKWRLWEEVLEGGGGDEACRVMNAFKATFYAGVSAAVHAVADGSFDDLAARLEALSADRDQEQTPDWDAWLKKAAH